MKNIAALLSFSSVSIKLIHCFKSGFYNSNHLLKPIAISLWWFKKIFITPQITSSIIIAFFHFNNVFIRILTKVLPSIKSFSSTFGA